LIPIDNLLLEDAISVPQTVAPGRIVQRGEAVKEASRKPPQATVAKRCVVLLLDDVFDAETEV
jgi:hypothetical protein